MIGWRSRTLSALAGLLLTTGAWTVAAAQNRPASSAAEDHSMHGRAQGLEENQQTRTGAMQAMQPGHRGHDPHLRLTPRHATSPADLERARKIVEAAREALEPYRDYRVALAEGYRIFMPNLPQEQYHFTNYWYGYLETFTFDPQRPSSLLYRKTRDGWELIGAMYTAPRTATLDELDERVPLSVAQWHAHINLCMPKRGTRPDWSKFGLQGSISTRDACENAGGRFFPQVFGWMVHLYPFETTAEKIWAH